jgi:hypothetical protein
VANRTAMVKMAPVATLTIQNKQPQILSRKNNGFFDDCDSIVFDFGAKDRFL